MHIRQPEVSSESQYVERAIDDLSLLLQQPDEKALRPCPGCKIECGCAKRSNSCTCACSMECPVAPAALSAEPERYPIEPGAVPIVFQLSTLRVLSPCWSCEGHVRSDGSVLRLPQVWHHCTSIVHLQIISSVLESLLHEKILARSWKISVCPLDRHNNTTFMIAPDFSPGAEIDRSTFERTQRDFIKMGRFLGTRVRDYARYELNRLKSARAKNHG